MDTDNPAEKVFNMWEIVVQIWSHLTWYDAYTLRSLTQATYDASPYAMTEIDTSDLQNESVDEICNIFRVLKYRGCKNLRKLDLRSSGDVTNLSIPLLEFCTQLEFLGVRILGDEHRNFFHRLRHNETTKHLAVQVDTPTNFTDLHTIAMDLHFQNLVHLELPDTAITDISLKEIADEQRNLESLVLNGCQYISDRGLSDVLELSLKLKHLNVMNTPTMRMNVSTFRIESLLQRLNVLGTHISKELADDLREWFQSKGVEYEFLHEYYLSSKEEIDLKLGRPTISYPPFIDFENINLHDDEVYERLLREIDDVDSPLLASSSSSSESLSSTASSSSYATTSSSSYTDSLSSSSELDAEYHDNLERIRYDAMESQFEKTLQEVARKCSPPYNNNENRNTDESSLRNDVEKRFDLSGLTGAENKGDGFMNAHTDLNVIYDAELNFESVPFQMFDENNNYLVDPHAYVAKRFFDEPKSELQELRRRSCVLQQHLLELQRNLTVTQDASEVNVLRESIEQIKAESHQLKRELRVMVNDTDSEEGLESEIESIDSSIAEDGNNFLGTVHVQQERGDDTDIVSTSKKDDTSMDDRTKCEEETERMASISKRNRVGNVTIQEELSNENSHREVAKLYAETTQNHGNIDAGTGYEKGNMELEMSEKDEIFANAHYKEAAEATSVPQAKKGSVHVTHICENGENAGLDAIPDAITGTKKESFYDVWQKFLKMEAAYERKYCAATKKREAEEHQLSLMRNDLSDLKLKFHSKVEELMNSDRTVPVRQDKNDLVMERAFKVIEEKFRKRYPLRDVENESPSDDDSEDSAYFDGFRKRSEDLQSVLKQNNEIYGNSHHFKYGSDSC